MTHKKPLFTACTLFATLALGSSVALADLVSPADAPAEPTAPATESAAADSSKDLAVVQRPVADLQAPQSDLKVTAWVDRPSSTYTFGENVVLSVKTNQDAYLTVLDVGTSGKVHIIFPNRFQKDNRVAANQVIQVPDPRANFQFQVGGPAGNELIKVFATQSAEALISADDTEPAGPYKALKSPAPAVAKDLAVVLREQHKNQWATHDKVIRLISPTAPIVATETSAVETPAVATTGTFAPSSVQPVSVPTDSFDLHLRTEKLVYPIGSKVRVMATAEKDCWLTLLNVGTSGKVYVLFPNRYQQDNQLQAGETVTIPANNAPVDYQLQGPTGVEALIGICRTSEESVYSGNYDFKQNVYQPWGNTKSLAKDLAVVLREPPAALAHTATTFLVVDE